MTKLKEETKKKIEETINKNNLNQDKSQNESVVVKAGKSLSRKDVDNIEPQLMVKDAKRNNYRRYK